MLVPGASSWNDDGNAISKYDVFLAAAGYLSHVFAVDGVAMALAPYIGRSSIN